MFYQVGVTFFKFLMFYATFLIAYGLGFYIMLHRDISSFQNTTKIADATENESSNAGSNIGQRVRRKAGSNVNAEEAHGEDDHDSFNVPLKSLMKTAVMFLGEIDDLPARGGNITQTLSYIFLLTFLFLMVMVLMNLLNGMAVSDTGKILQKSQILGQKALIDTIAYSESVLLNNLTTLQKLGRVRRTGVFGNFILSIVQKILLSSGAMLFESDYMKGTEELILPLRHDPHIYSRNICCRTNICLFILKKLDDDDIGDQVMFDARKIIEDNLTVIKD